MALSSCSVSRYLPEGKYLLDEVRVVSEDNPAMAAKLRPNVRQLPNTRILGVVRLPLHIYCLSGKSNSYVNRTLKKMGEAPHIYNDTLMHKSCSILQNILVNEGYLHAKVEAKAKYDGEKASVTYYIQTKQQYKIKSLHYTSLDTLLLAEVRKDTMFSKLHVGMSFNSDLLKEERARIAECLHDKGYYTFRKDYVTFIADTARYSHDVNLTVRVRNGNGMARKGESGTYAINPIRKYKIENVTYTTHSDEGGSNDMVIVDSIPFYFRDALVLRPSLQKNYSLIEKGSYYNASDVKDTYISYGRLGALKYTNVSFEETSDSTLNSHIILYPAKKVAIGTEVDVTHTLGDFGASASLSFSDRNLFGGSEMLTVQIRGAYETITQLQDYDGRYYLEYGADVGLTFPKLVLPFILPEYQRKSKAVTQVGLQYNAQRRPEFHRNVLSASWSYLWNSNQWIQHRFEPIGVNLVSVPQKDQHFVDHYLNQYNSANSIMKFNYEDLMILRTGYSFYYLSKNSGVRENFFYTSNTIRANVETAGGLLSMASRMLGLQQDTLGQYRISNIAFAQYLKADAAWTFNMNFDRNNSLLFHLDIGVAFPYGNSRMLPFEKRYYAGGANGVRGWSVRGLGPGSYVGRNGTIDYINQSGDVKLDMSLEYRMRLFWKLNGALFVDAGNIWTMYNYDDQPGGVFAWNGFYKQIAASYGVGVRADLNFLVLRFDVAMKAINPAYAEKELRYPVICPKFGRDFAWHFAVGYPF